MLDVEYLIFCRQVQMDENGISLLGTLDAIASSNFPATYPVPLITVAKIRAKKTISEQKLPFKIQIERPGEVVYEFAGEYPVLRQQKKDDVFFLHMDLNGVTLPAPGKYYVNLYIDGRKAITRILMGMTNEERDRINEQKIIQATD